MKGFIRPEASVLPDSAMVPPGSQVSPVPDQFTHELVRPEPYRFAGGEREDAVEGELPAGTPVVLLAYDGGPRCRVVDGRGLHLEVRFDSLRPL
jgi:hypothetical protein